MVSVLFAFLRFGAGRAMDGRGSIVDLCNLLERHIATVTEKLQEAGAFFFSCVCGMVMWFLIVVFAEDAVDGMGLAAKQVQGSQFGARLKGGTRQIDANNSINKFSSQKKDYRSELDNLKKQFSKSQYAVRRLIIIIIIVVFFFSFFFG